jgi:hypothetical protein
MRRMLILLAIISLIFCGCQEKLYRKVVPSTRARIQTNPYGGYCEVMLNSGENKVGEAIAFSDDKIYILGATELFEVGTSEIRTVKVVLTRNSSHAYFTMAMILSAPAALGMIGHSDYSADFFIVGATTFGIAGISTLIETGRKGKELQYPGDLELAEIQSYCRFPEGIPEGFDVTSLKGHLVK